jgi:hypothetical protein
MRYFIRAVKYFVQLMVILAIIIAILIVAKVVDSDISKIFVNGYDSLWQIALMMAAFAAIYPKFGYARRQAILPGSDEETAPVLEKVMNSFGYEKESRGDGVLAYRKRGVADRLLRMWEDRITVTRFVSGYELEGPNKDIVRLINAIRYND